MRWGSAALLFLLTLTNARADSLELRQGDHIVFIGIALADRMQQYG